MKRLKMILGFLAIGLASPSLAAPIPAAVSTVTDCPLKDMPFSAASPLIDILLSPAAKAALEKGLGTDLGADKSGMLGTEPPSFASILTVREAAGWVGKDKAAVERADAALRQVAVTDADRIARCNRYDNEVPKFALSGDGPKILLFEKINGFRDVPSVNAAHAALVAMAQRKGWQVETTQSGGAFNAETLSKFDAVIWNNISGDVLTLSQRKAMRDYIEGGGGFIGVHGTAGDPVYFWDWYVDTLIGARFAGHPMNPQFQDARVVVDDKSHPAAAQLPAEWKMRDEWYSFKNNPRDSGARIIATLDESSYDLTTGRGEALRMGADHPIAWSKVIGKGRMFYSAIGHMPETYAHPLYVKMLEDGIAWAAHAKKCDCSSED